MAPQNHQLPGKLACCEFMGTLSYTEFSVSMLDDIQTCAILVTDWRLIEQEETDDMGDGDVALQLGPIVEEPIEVKYRTCSR